MNLFANSLWFVSSLPASIHFALAARDVAGAQRRKLLSLLRANATTMYGRRFGFADIQSIEQYQLNVPLTTYEDIRPCVEQVEQGQQGILTQERVLLLEPTSGSASATKYIPYTRTLKQEFQAGIAPWVTYTFSRHPKLLLGQSYWSVSPVISRHQRSDGGIPIGFEDDSVYLSGVAGRVIRSLMAVPPEVKQIADLDSFRYVALLFLLRCRSLALVSVWNPTYFMLLLEPLAAWWPQLAEDIARGSISPSACIPAPIESRLSAQNRADPARAAEITRILRHSATTDSEVERGEIHRQLWPRLRLLSCWADANAGPYAAQLAKLFPQAQIQPKGLISTEAFVSFPILGKTGSALSLNSHFFEFLPIDVKNDVEDATSDENSGKSTPVILAHELESGQRYSVIVTTGGGLYRYRLHDQVEVTGKLRDCPLVRFVGRENLVCDWFGEKINEQHVRTILNRLLSEFSVAAEFVMVACDLDFVPPAYALYVQTSSVNEDTMATLGRELEKALQQNFHYAYCRRIGQLGELCVFLLTGDATGDYLRGSIAFGQRGGDIKSTLLSPHSGWSRILEGRYIKTSGTSMP